MPVIRKHPAAPTGSAVDPKGLLPSKILLVGLRSGEAALVHPDIAPYLEDGWKLKSAVPRIVEGLGARLLVVLTRSEVVFGEPSLPANAA